METKNVKLVKGNFRSYAAVAMCLKNNKGWSQYEWSDPPGTQYPARANNTHNECVFVQRGNVIFTDMVTGQQYNVEAGDRLSLPRGTTYTTLTHQGATYYWCSKEAQEERSGGGAGDGQLTGDIPKEECPW